MPTDSFYKNGTIVYLKKYSNTLFQTRRKIYYIFNPMKISESIEAHLSTAVATISQRNQATRPEFHKIFLFSVFYRLYHLAKAFGFCLLFLSRHSQPEAGQRQRNRLHGFYRIRSRMTA
jgi:hypothetical protein